MNIGIRCGQDHVVSAGHSITLTAQVMTPTDALIVVGSTILLLLLIRLITRW